MSWQRLLMLTVMVVLFHTLFRTPVGHSEVFDCLIEPYIVINLSSAVAGRLDTVLVDRGAPVKQGQIVATLESSVEQATVDMYRARATRESAIRAGEVRLELSGRQHSRSQGMFQKALIAANEMDEMETTKRLAELALIEATDARYLAELELKRAQAELSRRTIHSPITGVVVERFLSPGEFTDNNPILKLAQLDPLRVESFLPEARLGEIAVGMRATIMPQAPVNGTYTARVTVVDHVVDAASGTFGVRLELPNRDHRLLAGLKCKVRFLGQ